ncbi:hypothetical protein DFP73DRAFT_159364 [Morchella snyderi]|nr:hypothetical protein DFP73DRAFT_159364 [Morchella snyderi]
MSPPSDHGYSSVYQATPEESTDPISSLTDCLCRCAATGDVRTQEFLTKLVLNATSTAQRLISLQEENSPLGSKIKDLEQANSDSYDQIKLLNAKNRALKDSTHELQLTANWYKERLVESQSAEKEHFHAENILKSRLSKALMREEKMNKSIQEMRISVRRFIEKLITIYNHNSSEIENLLGDNLREWTKLKNSTGGTHEGALRGRKSAQAMSDLSREILDCGIERFQSRMGMRANSICPNRPNKQYAQPNQEEDCSSSAHDSYCHKLDSIDSDDSSERHQSTHVNEKHNNHQKIHTQKYNTNNNHQPTEVPKNITKNIGTLGLCAPAESNPAVWIAGLDRPPGSWNDVPTPPELLRKEKVVVNKYDCARVVKLTRLPIEITTAMVATFVRGGKIDDIRVIDAEKSNSFKQALITFCNPEPAASFFQWVQEYPGSLVVDGLRCHGVLGLTIQPPAYDRESRVLLLTSLPDEVNSINKLRSFVESTAQDDDGHPFTIQSQKLYFNGGGLKSSASITFDSIEAAEIMKIKWEIEWGISIEWGRDECEDRLLEMDPQMKIFWLTQPKPSGHQN